MNFTATVCLEAPHRKVKAAPLEVSLFGADLRLVKVDCSGSSRQSDLRDQLSASVVPSSAIGSSLAYFSITIINYQDVRKYGVAPQIGQTGFRFESTSAQLAGFSVSSRSAPFNQLHRSGVPTTFSIA